MRAAVYARVQIQGAVAEYERAGRSERCRRGKLRRAREGQIIGAKAPYGYRYEPRRDGRPGCLVIDEAEAVMVRQLCSWVADEGCPCANAAVASTRGHG